MTLLLGWASKAAMVALALVLHEAGHLLAAARFGVRVKRLGLGWMGCCLTRERTQGWPEIAICLSGVAMNLLLAALFWRTSHWFALANVTFGWVNLLPIPHSDGRHAREAWRSMTRRTQEAQSNG